MLATLNDILPAARREKRAVGAFNIGNYETAIAIFRAAEEQHFGASRDWLGVPDQQESFTCGEGAVVLPRIDLDLVAKLAKYVENQSDDPASDRIVVASPYTKLVLTRCTALQVETLEEVALKAL